MVPSTECHDSVVGLGPAGDLLFLGQRFGPPLGDLHPWAQNSHCFGPLEAQKPLVFSTKPLGGCGKTPRVVPRVCTVLAQNPPLAQNPDSRRWLRRTSEEPTTALSCASRPELRSVFRFQRTHWTVNFRGRRGRPATQDETAKGKQVDYLLSKLTPHYPPPSVRKLQATS